MEIVAKDNLILATVRIEPPYPATTISGQTWMAVNMSGDDGLGGISSYTWDNDWGTQYYYTLSAAKRIAASMYPGWHVPTKDEWNQLSGALYLTYIDPDYPPEYLPIARGTALGDVMRGQDGWARAKTAYTDINVFSALPVDNYWFTNNNEWTYPSAYSGECYFIADDPTANSALHYTVENMYESIQTRLSAQYRPFEGYNRDAHLGAEMNSVRLILDSTAQNTERPVIDKIYCVIEPPPDLGEIQIGNQIWASKNMAVSDGGDGIKALNPMNSSALYYTGAKNLSSQYSTEYYYTLDAAKRVAAAKYPGWHVPTMEDWNTLLEYFIDNSGAAGGTIGKYLRAPTGSNGWIIGQGNNAVNFSAIPNDALWRDRNTGNYLDPWYVGARALFWADETPLLSDGISGIFMMAYDNNAYPTTGAQLSPIYSSDAYQLQRNMLNVRLIKDS